MLKNINDKIKRGVYAGTTTKAETKKARMQDKHPGKAKGKAGGAKRDKKAATAGIVGERLTAGKVTGKGQESKK